MPQHAPLITTLAAALGLALLLGVLASRLRLPALLGYLLAGVLIGPFTPGFVADAAIAAELAEVGVMLLMFGVGLHFSLDDLLAVRRIAVPGALLQIAVATALGVGLAAAWGWGLGAGLVFGLALSVASTVVLLRALEDQGQVATPNGRLAVGWLIVEDLAMVLALVLLPALAGVLGPHAETAAVSASGAAAAAGSAPAPVSAAAELWPALGLTLLKVGGFIALMLVVGRRVFPALLWQVARSGSRELFTLCVVAAAVGIAYGATALFGVSFALGAFFAGMVLRESEFSHRAAQESLPLREAFAVLFFVSVGMLFDPRVLWEQPLRVLAVVATIVVGKSLAAAALVLALRHPLNTALTVSASLAQIGEFSFILAALGVSLGLLPAQGQQLVLAGALLSIALNPLWFRLVAPLQDWLCQRSALARRLAQPDDPLAELPANTADHLLSGQVVLVGHGRVGRQVAALLQARGLPFVVAERRRDRVEQLRAAGAAAVCGDATDPAVLVQAHVARAGLLVLALRDTLAMQQMLATARALNPRIELVLCTPHEADAELLAQTPGARVFVLAQAAGEAMARHVLQRYGHPIGAAAAAGGGIMRPARH